MTRRSIRVDLLAALGTSAGESRFDIAMALLKRGWSLSEALDAMDEAAGWSFIAPCESGGIRYLLWRFPVAVADATPTERPRRAA